MAWVAWDHPEMPWTSTRLLVAERHGESWTVAREPVAAGASVLQPGWVGNGLVYVTDRDGFWRVVHRPDLREDADVVLTPDARDHGYPPWVFGLSQHAPLSHGRRAAVRFDPDGERIVVSDSAGRVTALDIVGNLGYGPTLVSDGRDRLAFVLATDDRAPEIVSVDVSTGALTRVHTPGLDLGIALTTPEPIWAPGEDGRPVHAWLAAPPPDDDGSLPPLLVRCHGGPTAMSTGGVDPVTQFWTSRGFAVVDVNYRGSCGFGRAYRDALDGRWGELDVSDCTAVARHLAATGRVDGDRMVVRGSSAGGFTALWMLLSADEFVAGTLAYAVTDLERLAEVTHDFEAHYLARLVGTGPDREPRYRERSPRHHADRLRRPVLLLQGEADPVVPPEGAREMAAALAAAGVEHELVLYPDERHGFRDPEVVAHALTTELAFYRRHLGPTPGGD